MEIQWLKIPANLSDSLPKNRPYTALEAAYSVGLDMVLQKKGTLRGYASLWGWNHHKVKNFLNELGLLDKVIKNNQINFPKGSQNFPNEALKNSMLGNVISQTKPKSSAKSTRTIEDKEREIDICQSDPVNILLEAWNKIAVNASLRPVRKLTNERRINCQKRLKEHSVETWLEIIHKIPTMPFLCGQGRDGWKVDFDWITERESPAIKILEGAYADNRTHIDRDPYSVFAGT
jgi:hypothetical protein